jgi:hypothetical protein
MTMPSPLVTQLEYCWNVTAGKTFFDASNVAGMPFLNEGFKLDVRDPTPISTPKCYDAYCGPGDVNCNQVYNKADDDFQGMRDCSLNVDMRLTLCTG